MVKSTARLFLRLGFHCPAYTAPPAEGQAPGAALWRLFLTGPRNVETAASFIVESGEKGGQVLVAGTPEQVAKNTVSCTAQYLRGGVGKKKRK
jgi:hypothetical protein